MDHSRYHKEVYDQDNPEGEAHGWIQWKGTQVCMDVHCKCGAHCHLDAEFAYVLKCPHCNRVYAVGANVKLIELNDEQRAFVEGGNTCPPIVAERDEDLPE